MIFKSTFDKRWMLVHCVASASIVAVIFVGIVGTSIAKPVEERTAIRRIAAFEELVKDASWKVLFRQGVKPTDANNDWQMGNESSRLEAQVRSKPLQGMYHAAVQASSDYIDTGVSPPVTSKLGQSAVYSFDGSLFRYWHRYSENATIPVQSSPGSDTFGEISENDSKRLSGVGFAGTYGRPIGLHYMPPFFTLGRESRPLQLSSQLQANLERQKHLAIEEDSEGIWNISTFARVGPDGIDDWIDIRYDPTKGVILSARRYNPAHATHNKKEFELERMSFRIASHNGIWTPVAISALEPGQSVLYLWEFDDIAFNNDFTQKDFLVDFPPGVVLTDHVNGMHYVTGQDIVEEQRAVREYFQRYGPESGSIDSANRTSWKPFLIALNAVLIIILIAAVAWRYRTQFFMVVLPCFSVALFPSIAVAEVQGYQKAGGEWVISHSIGEEIVVTQCGLLSPFFVLEAFSIDYDPKTISIVLPPTSEGISLADISDVLSAHGLHVGDEKVSGTFFIQRAPTWRFRVEFSRTRA